MTAKTLNLIYTRPLKSFGVLSPELAAMISGVSKLINLRDVSRLVDAEIKGDILAKNELDSILAETEIMYGFPPPSNLLERAPRLKWIQNPLVGVEMFLKPDFISSPVILTNARGIHDQVAELAFMLALMLTKNAPASLQQQSQKQYRQFIPGVLSGKTLGVVGLGHIGTRIAQIGQAFRMRVLATEIKSMKKPSYVYNLLSADKLPELLQQSDYVMLAVPLTGETAKMLGVNELKMMKPTAFLINVARGGIIDEDALIAALKDNKIAGAGLDVYTKEPLRPESPLWELPNVILTPHVAGLREDYDTLTAQLFCRNLKRYIAGKVLLNVVDKVKGS